MARRVVKDNKKGNGLIVAAFLFLGLGIGAMNGYSWEGGLIGLGTGLLASAFVKHSKKFKF